MMTRKLLSLFITLLFFQINTNAQLISNGDFESWRTYGVDSWDFPDGFWYNFDSVANRIRPTILKSTDANSGQYAIELQSFEVNGTRFTGRFTNGFCCNAVHAFYGVEPLVDTFSFLKFHAKYNTANSNDSFMVRIVFCDTNLGTSRMTTYRVHIAPPVLGQYMEYYIPIKDTLRKSSFYFIDFASELVFLPGRGEVSLLIDDIEMLGDTTRVVDTTDTSNHIVDLIFTKEPLTIQAFPNPSSHSIKIDFENSYQTVYSLRLYNHAGQQVKQIDDYAIPHSIDVSSLPNGLYNVELLDQQGIRRTGAFLKM
jgi:hypothetical protein